MKTKTGKSNIEIVRSYLNGERPFTQIGYREIKKKRKIGEIWTDVSGITWKQENGYKSRVNKQADIIRESAKQICKKCNSDIKWGSKLDHYFFSKSGMCESCLISYETDLRILGIYEHYERYKIASYTLNKLIDAKENITDTIKYFNENNGDVHMVCNSDGFIERWKNTNIDKIKEDATKDLQLINEKIEKITQLKNEFRQLYIDNAKSYNIEVYV